LFGEDGCIISCSGSQASPYPSDPLYSSGRAHRGWHLGSP